MQVTTVFERSWSRPFRRIKDCAASRNRFFQRSVNLGHDRSRFQIPLLCFLRVYLVDNVTRLGTKSPSASRSPSSSYVSRFRFYYEVRQMIYTLFFEPHAHPFRHGFRSKFFLIKINRRLVPLENGPVQPRTILLLCDPS